MKHLLTAREGINPHKTPVIVDEEVGKKLVQAARERCPMVRLSETEKFKQATPQDRRLMVIVSRARRSRNLKYILDPDE
jgi:hypothetical protein